MKASYLFLLATLMMLFSIYSLAMADTTYTNVSCGYSIVLPDTWQVINASDSQDIFFDANSDGKTFISVVHHRISDTTLETDWSRFHYIMYLSVTQEWEDPWGTILALDSSQTSLIDQTWAPQAFAQFVALNDTDYDYWSEYIMFTAKYHSGYEIYAIGDTLDLKTNGGIYSQIMFSLTFSDASPVFKNVRKPNFRIIANDFDKKTFDLFGRIIPENTIKNKSTMLYIRNRIKVVNNIR